MTVSFEQSGLRIGELAERTGVSARSLRYYEQRGLLTSHRDHNGYRRYDETVVPLVANLRRLLDAGLSVADIQRFGHCLTEPDMDLSPCAAALDVYEQRLRTLDDLITTLTRRRTHLATHTEDLRVRIRSGD